MVLAIPPTVCLWDFDSVKVRDYQLQPLVKRIRERVFVELGRNAEKSFLVCCDVRKLSASTTRALNKIRNLDIVHVDNVENNTSEEKLKQKLHQVDIDYRDDPGIIVLISGNGDFGYFLSNMGRSGWRVMLFHHGTVTKELTDCVDYHYEIQEMLDDIDADESVQKPRSEEGKTETAYILVTNLPPKMPADKVVTNLQSATDEFTGKVCYFNQLTGESVLTFDTLESEGKGTTALFLAKNCKSLLGLDLSVLAIKDPCAELSRMKFTVQQLGEVSRPPMNDWSSRTSSVESAAEHPATEVNTLSNKNGSSNHPGGKKMRPGKDDQQQLQQSYEMNDDGRVAEYMSHTNPSVVRDYASAVKKPPGSSRSQNLPTLKPMKHETYVDYDNVAPPDDGTIVTNGYRPYFQKPAMQCFHWDNPAHLSQSLRDCKFWHPRERCRFYPQCMMGAETCGYAHPFCGVYCECEPEMRDPQKNHRLKAPAYIRNAMLNGDNEHNSNSL